MVEREDSILNIITALKYKINSELQNIPPKNLYIKNRPTISAR